jgi:hypothetical protein
VAQALDWMDWIADATIDPATSAVGAAVSVINRLFERAEGCPQHTPEGYLTHQMVERVAKRLGAGMGPMLQAWMQLPSNVQVGGGPARPCPALPCPPACLWRGGGCAEPVGESTAFLGPGRPGTQRLAPQAPQAPTQPVAAPRRRRWPPRSCCAAWPPTSSRTAPGWWTRGSLRRPAASAPACRP